MTCSRKIVVQEKRSVVAIQACHRCVDDNRQWASRRTRKCPEHRDGIDLLFPCRKLRFLDDASLVIA